MDPFTTFRLDSGFVFQIWDEFDLVNLSTTLLSLQLQVNKSTMIFLQLLKFEEKIT